MAGDHAQKDGPGLWLERVEGAGKDVSAFARAIVAKRTIAVQAIAALITLGIIPESVDGTLEHWLQIATVVLSTLGGIAWSSAGVTPADPNLAPKANDGTPLVPAPALPADLSVGSAADLSAINAALNEAQAPTPDAQEAGA